MNKLYYTPEHYEKMSVLFPSGIGNFCKDVGDGLYVSINEGRNENKDGIQILLEYKKELFPQDIVERLSPRTEKFMACTVGVFFGKDGLVIPAIQGQSFSDIGAMAVLMKNKKITLHSEIEFSQLQQDFADQKDNIQKKLFKKLGMPPHDFMFLLASLVATGLGGEKIQFLKKTVTGVKSAKQDQERAYKLQQKIPLLRENEYSTYWTKDESIHYIATLPDKPRELLFEFFDSLQTYRNRVGEQRY